MNAAEERKAAKRAADEVEYRVRTALALYKGGHDHEAQIAAGRASAERIVLEALRNRHRGPITDEDALRFGKIAWVTYQEDKEWARSVVDDCFSPADDLPEEALDMIAVARAVLEAAEVHRA